MRKLCAILAGLVLFCAAVFALNGWMDYQIGQNKEAVRNWRTYERFWSTQAQSLVMDENTLPIFGSSELVPLEDYQTNVSSFLNGTDMNIMTIGAGSFQSLSHTMTLGALAGSIKSGKVALFLSPQWFSETGITADAFPSRFGEDALLEFLANPNISRDNKTYVVERTLDLLSESPAQYARVKRYQQSIDQTFGINGFYTQIMSQYWNLRGKFQVYRQLSEMSHDLPYYDLASLNFSDILNLAEAQGRQQCTNNDFGVYDEYWNTYVQDTYSEGEVKEKRQVYTSSPEYEDLRCFLRVADELDIEVILVSIPVNEKWYTYRGSLCDTYYDNIRSIAAEYENVSLIDMTEYGNEKYFFKDVMHWGWKGWTRNNEALYHEFTAK